MHIPFSHKQLIIGTSISIAVLFASFLAWWALYYNNPNRILGNALTSLSQAETAGFKGNLSAGGLNFSFDGDTSRQATAFNGTLSLGALALKGQVRADSQATYVRLDNAKEIAQKATSIPLLAPYLTQLSTGADALQDKWLKIADGTHASDNNACTDLLTAGALTTGQQRQLGALFRQHQFIRVAEKLGTEQINGQSHLHYKLAFNQANATHFTSELLKIEPFKSSQKCLSTGFDKADQKLFEKLEQTDIEVWIHERSHDLAKITALLRAKNLTLTFALNLDLHKQVQITMPTADIVPLKELLETIKNGRKSL